MKIELHCHTCESSPCANSSANEAVSLYMQQHYDVLVITNHYNSWVLEQSGLSTGIAYTNYFLEGYRQAHSYALKKKLPLKILLGAEVSLHSLPNDYLLFGMEETFFYQYPELMSLSLEELSKLCHEQHILLYQAHPFRAYCEAVHAELLDGIEVFNGNPRHQSHNEKALAWAKKENKLMSSGSDYHQAEDVGIGGIITTSAVNNQKELCLALKEKTLQRIEGSCLKQEGITS